MAVVAGCGTYEPPEPVVDRNSDIAIHEELNSLLVPTSGRDCAVEFAVHNTSSTQSRTFTLAKRSCGCIAVEPEQFTLPASGERAVSMNTRIYPGPAKRLVAVFTEDASNASITLDLTVTPTPELQVTPESRLVVHVKPLDPAVVNFEVITNSHRSTNPQLKVASARGSTLTITPSESKANYATDAKFETQHYKVTVGTEFTTGEHLDETLEFECNGRGSFKTT